MKKFFICLMALMVGLFYGCKKEVKTLVVGVLFDVGSAPLFIAQKESILPEHIKLIRYQNAEKRDIALASGTIDGAVCDIVTAVSLYSEGVDLRITSRLESPEPPASGGEFEDITADAAVVVFTQTALVEKSSEVADFYRVYNHACSYMRRRSNSKNVSDLISHGVFQEDVRDVLILPEYADAAMPEVDVFDACVSWMLDKGIITDRVEWEELTLILK